MRRAVAGIMTLVLLCFPALASDAEMTWDQQGAVPADSTSVYFGSVPGAYGPPIIGIVTNMYVFADDQMFQNVRNYVAFTAVNATGESGFSEEVNGFPRPRVTSAVPVDMGTFIQLTINGSNFSDGVGTTDVQITGMAVVGVTRVDATQLLVDYTIDPGTPSGPADMTVVSKWNGASGTLVGPVSVVFLVPSLVPLPPIPTGVD